MNRPLSSIWEMPLRVAAYVTNAAYVPIAYRLRGWGRLPRKRGPTLLISNHQNDLETMALVSRVGVTQSSWRHPIFSICSRRMHEPGFMATRLPWTRGLLRKVNAAPLFIALGLLPLENHLRTRSIMSLAWAVHQRHGAQPFDAIFTEPIAGRFPPGTTTDDMFVPANFERAQAEVSLRDLREPFRRDILDETRLWIERDLAALEDIVRRGGTMYVAPEGGYSTDGRIHRLRASYERLAPLATVYLAGVSYDPFVSKRLSMLFRIQPLTDRARVREELAAIRPVTVSQLIGEWLYHHDDGAFTRSQAVAAVERRLHGLPATLFVDPEFRARPARRIAHALTRLCDLGILDCTADGMYRLGENRKDPRFPPVPDMLAHQANFLEETIAATQTMTS